MDWLRVDGPCGASRLLAAQRKKREALKFSCDFAPLPDRCFGLAQWPRETPLLRTNVEKRKKRRKKNDSNDADLPLSRLLAKLTVSSEAVYTEESAVELVETSAKAAPELELRIGTQKLSLEALEAAKLGTSVFLNAGGGVSRVKWLPVPLEHCDQCTPAQYLAVLADVTSQSDGADSLTPRFRAFGETMCGTGLLQIWRFATRIGADGEREISTSPTLSHVQLIEGGAAHDIAFLTPNVYCCQRGRLAVCAVACGDGKVRVYVLPSATDGAAARLMSVPPLLTLGDSTGTVFWRVQFSPFADRVWLCATSHCGRVAVWDLALLLDEETRGKDSQSGDSQNREGQNEEGQNENSQNEDGAMCDDGDTDGDTDTDADGDTCHEPLQCWQAHANTAVRSASFAPFAAHLLATCAQDGTLAIWNVRDPRQPLLRGRANQSPLLDAVWLPGQQSLLCASEQTANFRCLRCFHFDHAPATQFAPELESAEMPDSAAWQVSVKIDVQSTQGLALSSRRGNTRVESLRSLMQYETHTKVKRVVTSDTPILVCAAAYSSGVVYLYECLLGDAYWKPRSFVTQCLHHILSVNVPSARKLELTLAPGFTPSLGVPRPRKKKKHKVAADLNKEDKQREERPPRKAENPLNDTLNETTVVYGVVQAGADETPAQPQKDFVVLNDELINQWTVDLNGNLTRHRVVAMGGNAGLVRVSFVLRSPLDDEPDSDEEASGSDSGASTDDGYGSSIFDF